MRVMLLSGLLIIAGCDTMEDWYGEGYVTCDGKNVDIKSNPLACGGCPPEGIVCGEGVACINYKCDYNSVLHCGAAGRACMGDERAVCIAVPAGVDASLPVHGPVVNGYACALTPGGDEAGGEAARRDEGSGEAAGGDEVGEAGSADTAGQAADGASGEGAQPRAGTARGAPRWMFIPGRSEGCRGSDPRRCHHAWVDFTDICDEQCDPLPFDYDFSVMTTELSRAHYREAMCNCDRVRTPECADVCDAERSAMDALPMTGLDWCRAQTACEALDGRLPTALERTRIEQVLGAAYTPKPGKPGLFNGAGCGDWRRAVGSKPRVAECVDGDGTGELVAVDDLRGAVVVGAGVMPRPMIFHHALGNAAEWLLSEPAPMRCVELQSDNLRLRTPRAWEGLRAMQGRSILSPRGESPDRLISLTPSSRAVDVGVRCVRPEAGASGAPELPPLDEYCGGRAPEGRATVRRSSDDAIYRAVEACADSRAPTASGFNDIELFTASLTHAAMPLVWRAGDAEQVGQAWFAHDAQWWIHEPATLGGELTYDLLRRQTATLRVRWQDLSDDVSGACVGGLRGLGSRMSHADHDAYILRRLDFIIDRDQIELALWTADDAAQVACTHFVCEGLDDPNACVTDCSAWRLSLVIGFEQIEPFVYPDLCD